MVSSGQGKPSQRGKVLGLSIEMELSLPPSLPPILSWMDAGSHRHEEEKTSHGGPTVSY